MKKSLLSALFFLIATTGFSQETYYALVEKSSPMEYEKYFYNTDMLLESSENLWEDGTKYKDSLRYNGLNQVAQLDIYQLIDNQWKYTSYIEYTYDENGNITSRSNYNNFGGPTFTLGGIYNFFYEDDRQTGWELWLGANDLLEIGSLNYNPQGQLFNRIAQSFFGGSTPENSWKQENEYNADGSLKASKQYSWNGSSWIYTGGEWFEYDVYGNCIESERRSGNLVMDRYFYTYNMDISQDNIILPIDPEKKIHGGNQIEMQHMLVKSSWFTLDEITNELTYIWDYLYNYQIIPILGIPSHEMAAENIIIFPSPARDEVTVLNRNSTVNGVKIFDINGRQVLNISNGNQREMKVNVSHLKSGTYIMDVSTHRGSVFQKLIVQ